MVPQKHLGRVAGLNQALQGLASIVAPPLGAVLMTVLPIQGMLAIDLATAALAIAALVLVRVPQPEHSHRGVEASGGSVVTDLRQGVRFLRGWPGMLAVIGIAMVVNLLVHPAISLQPLLVADHFARDAFGLALLQSALGIGFVAGGLTLGAWGGFKRQAVTGLSALVLMGVGFATVGAAPPDAFPVAGAGMFLAGFMTPIVNGSISAVLQATVPPEMHGRVFTLLMSGVGLMSPLGLGVAGPLADVLGVRFWFVAAGIAMTAMGISAFFVPAILRLEDKPAAATASRDAGQVPSVGGSPPAAAVAR
jgi:DHA3 family macrolide efflux protein-like MFS transporter